MAKTVVDNSGEVFGSKVSIADLAQFSFNGRHSDTMSIYTAEAVLQNDWQHELFGYDMEYATGICATFKDGSKLNVGAWADCCDGSGCTHCR